MPTTSSKPTRWVVNTDYLSIERRGEDPVRVERGEEFPGEPSKALIDQEWVCPMPEEQAAKTAPTKSEGGA